MKAMVRLPDGDTIFFDINASVLQGDILALYSTKTMYFEYQ